MNPLTYTDRVVSDFLSYQLTTYAFADSALNQQMRRLLNLDRSRFSPLLQGPFISLSRSFQEGASIDTLVREGVLHPHMRALVPHPRVYGHQEDAIRAIRAGRTTLVSTGTGSGKTECFLYPIISRCLELRDRGAPPGIVAVLVYPMNALAEDQLGRLRELLTGSGVPFGMYIGRTVEAEAQISGRRMPGSASRAMYAAWQAEELKTGKPRAIHPPEERVSREELRANPPRILLTNVKQLELLLTRQQDVALFDGALLDFLVFDEAHTFSGAQGAETACLIRRLRSYCGREPTETVCVATSATIADVRQGPEAGREFAHRFFGVPRDVVALVGERYEEERWAERPRPPAAPSERPQAILETILAAVKALEQDGEDAEALWELSDAFAQLTGQSLDPMAVSESLYEALSSSAEAVALAGLLDRPWPLAGLLGAIRERIGREMSEEEALCWLTLGAAARRGGRPLLRPVVHAFVRGVSGAVVDFPARGVSPRLWLSAEDAEGAGEEALIRLPVMTCTTCGQHYFAHRLFDFRYIGRAPEGGERRTGRVVWQTDDSPNGKRVVLLDRLVAEEDGEAEEGPRNTAPLYLCRHCGAAHAEAGERCLGCGRAEPMVRLFAVRQKEHMEGLLTACLACGALGRMHGQWREPARPIRALTVSDVHVLGQSLIHHAERRRLLIFTDNRQDAAFQAGWMMDHARRYRFRTLIAERLEGGSVSVGDLAGWIDARLDENPEISQALAREVWLWKRPDGVSREHADARALLVRILLLRELTTGNRQRIGLEPWGRLRVEYHGLSAALGVFGAWAGRAGCTAAELCAGVEGLLDHARRSQILYDREREIFSRFFRDGDPLVQHGFLPPVPGGPVGLVLRRAGDQERAKQWLSERGSTLARQLGERWGLGAEEIPAFFTAVWEELERLGILVPVVLKGERGNPLPRTQGLYQIDASMLLLHGHRAVYRCDTCRRTQIRATPGRRCLAWRCQGVVTETEEVDDYNRMVVDQRFEMVRPREHSAQIPADQREQLEREFKGGGGRLNTLVCTPTLELGVDIGGLDAVLMRNVPPKPANYWQRAGRAGRRHRMALNITYARPSSHDRAYFAEPQKMLQGRVYPPSFNLKNEVMIRKHLHASALTVLHRIGRRDRGLLAALEHCFPTQIKRWLFDGENVRRDPYDLAPLREALRAHRGALTAYLRASFPGCWPAADAAAVEAGALDRWLDEMPGQLEGVIALLRRRLSFTLEHMRRLDGARAAKGTLEPEEDAFYRRLDRLVKRLKGVVPPRTQDSEGHDDANTMAVLAAEGFLPGYGLDAGGVLVYYQAPLRLGDLRDWEIRRSPSLAIRENVPGNLLYANGSRFVPRFFHLQADEALWFAVDAARGAVAEVQGGGGGGFGVERMRAIRVCDVDLPHHSSISDEESFRFQLGVAVYGYEQPWHAGGRAWTWGGRAVTYRRGVRLRLVNVGATGGTGLGYPICTVCGQSRSPFASEAELGRFGEDHRVRCGRKPEQVGFYTDTTADALCLPGCTKVEAYSLLEALRLGAAEVLEMEQEDLQVLVIARPLQEEVDAVLYDPMPGGSGLIEQMLARWSEVVVAARQVAAGCPGRCRRSCVDCLQNFRNGWYHMHLSRHEALSALEARGASLVPSHEIPIRLPDAARAEGPDNAAEEALRALLERAGFHGWEAQRVIELGMPLGRTRPDFFFADPEDRREGICIYLDGMSRRLHGDPATARRDREIREELRERGYEVIEIQASQLQDKEAMRKHFYRLGRLLLGRQAAEAIRAGDGWFG